MTDPSPARVAAERGRSERRQADRWHPSSTQPAETASPVPAPTLDGQRDAESRDDEAPRWIDVGDLLVTAAVEAMKVETRRSLALGYQMPPTYPEMARAALVAVLSSLRPSDVPHLERQIRESIAGEINERVEYGHVLPDGGWLPEHRGIKYATHQRTVRYRLGEPVPIDHFTYTDHRHPVEGCTHDRHDLTTRPSS